MAKFARIMRIVTFLMSLTATNLDAVEEFLKGWSRSDNDIKTFGID